jgi:tetratricopeptide (TPR) repeat protein
MSRPIVRPAIRPYKKSNRAETKSRRRNQLIQWLGDKIVALLVGGSGIVALLGLLQGAGCRHMEQEFVDCRKSIEDAVNSSQWARAQRIGIACTARLNLESDKCAEITLWLGKAYEGSEQLPEALENYTKAYEAASALKNEHLVIDSLLGSGRILRLLGRPEDAKGRLREALIRVERLGASRPSDYHGEACQELSGMTDNGDLQKLGCEELSSL